MTPSEARRRQLHFVRARRRWKAANPDRKYVLDGSAVYVAPPELRPLLGEERGG